jgi:hypothetical protein
MERWSAIFTKMEKKPDANLCPLLRRVHAGDILGITWDEFLRPQKAAKGLRPYGVVSSTTKGDEASAYWGLMWFGAGVGSAIGGALATGGLTASSQWFAWNTVMRFHPAFAVGSLVLYSPDIAFAVGEDIESEYPGSGGQMTNALHYSQGGMISGGVMPVVPMGSGKYGMPDMSWSSIRTSFGW